MANLGAAVGITFTICPAVGGAITAAAQDDYSITYYAAATIAGLGILFALINLKKPKKTTSNK